MNEESRLRAQRYRLQAAEILRTAEQITDMESHAMLVRLAETYVRLAAMLEQSSPKADS